jgi:hypothetical protein
MVLGLPLAALLPAFSGVLLLLTGLLLSAALLLLTRLLLFAALLLLSRRPLTALLLTLLLIASLILLNIFVRISHLKYLIVESQRPHLTTNSLITSFQRACSAVQDLDSRLGFKTWGGQSWGSQTSP